MISNDVLVKNISFWLEKLPKKTWKGIAPIFPTQDSDQKSLTEKSKEIAGQLTTRMEELNGTAIMKTVGLPAKLALGMSTKVASSMLAQEYSQDQMIFELNKYFAILKERAKDDEALHETFVQLKEKFEQLKTAQPKTGLGRFF